MIFNIPPSCNFLESLAQGILERFGASNLANITILLPTARACAKLQKILSKLSNRALFLPQIKTIGEIEHCYLLPVTDLQPLDELSHQEQILLLCQLLETQDYNLVLSLSNLLDRLARDQIDVTNLTKIYNEHLSDNNHTLQYLQLIASKWPKILSEYQKTDSETKRAIFINRLIASWEDTPPTAPVIVAGSTGSVRSTAKLLSAMSQINNCFVITYGIDHTLNTEYWGEITYSHPLYYLKKLYQRMNVDYKRVEEWTTTEDDEHKTRFLNLLFSPDSSIQHWQTLTPDTVGNLGKISIVSSNNQREEALIVGFKAREFLAHHPNGKIAIICNDQLLKQQIINAAQIWNLPIDAVDKKVSDSKQVQLMQYIWELVTNFNVITLLDFFKHPFLRAKYDSRLITILEKKYCRGICNFTSLAELIPLIKEDDLRTLLIKLQQYIGELQNLSRATLSDLLKTHITILEKISDKNTLWSSHSAQQIAMCLRKILTLKQAKMQPIDLQDYWPLLLLLLNSEQYSIALPHQASISLISRNEARLLNFDFAILTNFNETDWPEQSPHDPWLNQETSRLLDLTPVRNRIGQVAYDLYLLAHNSNLLITRSLKNLDQLTTASRWLIRLEILSKKLNIESQLYNEQHNLLHWSKHYYRAEPLLKEQDLPRPASHLRPRTLSVTSVEKLMRDPYGYYAAKILKLKPLEPINRPPNQSDFGSLVHKIIELFATQYELLPAAAYDEFFDQIILKELNSMLNRPLIKHLWLPKLKQISKILIEFEQTRRANNSKIYSEVSGLHTVKTEHGPCQITAKADRIEQAPNQLVTIIDFKTGSIPSQRDISQGYSPQLTLEALIAANNGFDGIDHAIAQQLLYVSLAGNKIGKIIAVKDSLDELLAAAKEGITALLNLYLDPTTPYIPCPDPDHVPTYNDYEHLERV